MVEKRKVQKKACPLCEREVSNSNFGKHYSVCSGAATYTAWNKGLTKHDTPGLMAASVKMKAKFESGELTVVGAAAWTTAEFKAHAAQHGFGGYKPNAGRSKKFHVSDSAGATVCLQSTYELKCSELLNELGIDWNRPSALKYNDGTKDRNYFPDFFLPQIGIYLDPKNSFLAVKDEAKIQMVQEQNGVKVVVLLQEHLNSKFIKELCV